MIVLVETPTPHKDLNALHAHFLAILPRIETHAKVRFRYLRCPGRRDDMIAEVIAVCWRWFLRLNEKGSNAGEFAYTLADLAVRHVRSGRRLCGQERAKDVLSTRAQRMKGFRVEGMPSSTRRRHKEVYSDPQGQDRIDAFEERLRDNTVTPPDEQAAFRIDYPLWLSRLDDRQRRIALDMALDLGTQELASRFQVSPGRISQLRKELHTHWRKFCGETAVC
ncbi:MAG: hypothetical protein U0840_29940 [Gemmataceae bacterium]